MEALTRAMSKQDRQPHMTMQGKAFGVPCPDEEWRCCPGPC
jgi:hypothetical protein